jgi:DNA replication protein DnaC
MNILDPALRNALRTLKLTGMLETLDARLAQTRDDTLGHLEFLQVLCEDEIARRESAALTRRIRRARFEEQSTFESFDFTANTKLPAAMLRDLSALRWLDAAESVILYGPVGTGKSHLLIGLGLAACEQGRRVRYVTTAQLVNELVEAADERVLSRVVGRYGRLDLLCLDELGYVQIDPRGAELLFQIITEREERASIAIATNLPFSEWGTVFPDPRLVAAIVDRVTFNAHILETGTQSYRLRTSKTTARRKRAS